MKKRHDDFGEFPIEEVRSAIRAGIDQAELQKDNKIHVHKNNNRKRRVWYTFASVAAIFGILVFSSHHSLVLASSLSQIPLIGSIFGNSDEISLRKAHENGLTSEIGETQTKNGVSVTLNEILYDQNNLTVGFFIESEKELSEEYFFDTGIDFTINGKLPKSFTGSYGEEILSETTRTAIYEVNQTGELPDAFDLGLILHGENGETWYFSTAVEKIAVQTIPVHHSQTVDGVELSVPEITYSETGVSIAIESSEVETDFDLARGGYIEFLVIDQDGNELTGRKGGTSGERVKDQVIFKSNKQFEPLDSHVTELTITPYVDLPSSGGGVELDENGNEIELENKCDLVKQIEFDSFKVQIPPQ